jgi:hypothetical protein
MSAARASQKVRGNWRKFSGLISRKNYDVRRKECPFVKIKQLSLLKQLLPHSYNMVKDIYNFHTKSL